MHAQMLGCVSRMQKTKTTPILIPTSVVSFRSLSISKDTLKAMHFPRSVDGGEKRKTDRNTIERGELDSTRAQDILPIVISVDSLNN